MLATLIDDGTVLVKIAAAVGAILVIGRTWLWMAEMTHALRRIVILLPSMEVLRKLEPLVDTIAAEFRRNGGSTLADKVRVIEKTVLSAADEAKEARHEAKEAKNATKEQNKVLEDIQKKTIHQDEVLDHQDKMLEEIKGTVSKLACQPGGDGTCHPPKT